LEVFVQVFLSVCQDIKDSMKHLINPPKNRYTKELTEAKMRDRGTFTWAMRAPAPRAKS